MAGTGLGERVKAARISRGMTMAELATACGLTKGFISQMESGSSNPSLNTLRKIASALQIPVSGLLAAADPSVFPVASQMGQARPVILHEAHGSPSQPGILLLAAGPAGAHALVTMSQGGRVVYTPSDETQETQVEAIITVLAGAVTLKQNEDAVELSRGGVASCDANVDYSIEAPGLAGAGLLLFMPQGSTLPMYEAATVAKQPERSLRSVSAVPFVLGVRRGRRRGASVAVSSRRSGIQPAVRGEGPLQLVAMRAQRLAERSRKS